MCTYVETQSEVIERTTNIDHRILNNILSIFLFVISYFKNKLTG
jgi:hypothetical protein